MFVGGYVWEQGEGGVCFEFEGQGQVVVEMIELGCGLFVFEVFLLVQFLVYLLEQQVEY